MIEFRKWWDSYGCFITQHNSESSIDFRIRVAEAAWEHAYHEGLTKMKELQGENNAGASGNP